MFRFQQKKSFICFKLFAKTKVPIQNLKRGREKYRKINIDQNLSCLLLNTHITFMIDMQPFSLSPSIQKFESAQVLKQIL